MQVTDLYDWGGCILCAIVLGLAMLYMPNKILLKVGCVISPNLMSIIHTPIVWVGYFVFYDSNVSIFWGLMLVVFGAVLDRIDGRLAKILDVHLGLPDPKTFRKSLFHKGGSEWGKKIDPAMDKAAVLPVYADIAYDYIKAYLANGLDVGIGWVYLIGAFLIIATILTDLCGTIIRLDYFKYKGWIRGTGATWAGKTKVLIQWLWLVPYTLADQGWILNQAFEYSIVLDVFLFIIFALAVISLLSKIFSLKGEWDKNFEHDVES